MRKSEVATGLSIIALMAGAPFAGSLPLPSEPDEPAKNHEKIDSVIQELKELREEVRGLRGEIQGLHERDEELFNDLARFHDKQEEIRKYGIEVGRSVNSLWKKSDQRFRVLEGPNSDQKFQGPESPKP